MANSSDDFSRVISEEVTCPVCLMELKEPKMLVCSHNVCRECLELMSINKNLIHIDCPACRTVTPIPKGGVRCLPTNTAIVEDTLARKAKIEMKKSLATRKPVVEVLAEKISDLDKALRVENEIHEKADKLVDIIRNQEATLCRKVEEFYGIKCETINEYKSNLDKLHSSASKSVQEAETILKQTLTDPTKTINVAKALKEQMEEITKLDLNRDTSTCDEDLEFEINAEANINSIFEDKKFGKLLTRKVLNTDFTRSDDLPRQSATPPPQRLKSTSNTKGPKPVPHIFGGNYCDFCGLAANLICKPCLKTICHNCKHAYIQDLCPPTKREHKFENINEESSNTNEPGSKDSSSPWSCEWCTFLNSSSHRICAVCARTRGVHRGLDIPKNGRKCPSCTYVSKEGAIICQMCSGTFGLENPESYI